MANTLSVADVLIRWRQEGNKDVQTAITATEQKALSLSKAFDTISGRAKAAGTALSVGVTAPLVLIGKQAIDAASNLNEAMSAVDTVFGRTAPQVVTFAKDAATNLGQSQQAALSAASALGALFQGVGLNNTQMADFSKNVLQASADLSSFFNVDSSSALQALRSGLVGEAEGLRQFGILLNETAVKAKAVELGLAGVGDELTEGQKVQARYALIMEQLGAAQGDFARTSNGLANGSRILRARLADLSAQIGQVLLPYAIELTDAANALVERFLSLDDGSKRIAVAFGAIAAAAGPGLLIFGQVASSLAKIGPILAALTGPVGLAVAGIAALGLAYKTNFLGIADTVNGAAKTVQEGIGRVTQYFKSATDRGTNPFFAALRGFNVWAVETFGRGHPIAEFLRAVQLNARRLTDYLQSSLVPAFRRVGDALQEGGIAGAIRQTLKELPKIGEDIARQVRRLANPIIESIRGIDWNGIGGELWRRFIGAIRGADWTGMGDALGRLVQRGLSALSNIGSWVLSALRGEGSGDGHRGNVAGNLAGAVLGYLRDRFAEVDWGTLGDDILAGLQRAVALAFDFARWGWDRIKDLASFVSGKVNGADWDSVKRTLGDWGAIVAAEFPKWMFDRLGDLRNLGTWVYDRVKGVDWTNVLTTLKDAGSGLIGQLLQGMGDKMLDVQSWIAGGKNAEGGSSQGLGDRLSTAISGAFAKTRDKLIEAGKAPIGWLLQGMTEEWTKVAEWIAARQQDIENFANAVRNIGSGSGTGGDSAPSSGRGGKHQNEEQFTRGAMGTVGRGNWALVGEAGPELVKLPTGAMVIPHGASMARLQGAVSQLAAGGIAGKGWINWFNNLSDAERRRRVERGINRELPAGWMFAEDYSVVPSGYYGGSGGGSRDRPPRERTPREPRGREEPTRDRDRDRRRDLTAPPSTTDADTERNRDRRERASSRINEDRPLGSRRNPYDRESFQDYKRQVARENADAAIPAMQFFGPVNIYPATADLGYEISRQMWESGR